MRKGWMAAVLAAAGCVPSGGHQGGGGYDPAPAPPAPAFDINGQWHLESTEDSTGRTGKGVAWLNLFGSMITARMAPNGGKEMTMTGTLGTDGSFHGSYWVMSGGVNRQASMSGQIKSGGEISGRWAVPGVNTGSFRFLR